MEKHLFSTLAAMAAIGFGVTATWAASPVTHTDGTHWTYSGNILPAQFENGQPTAWYIFEAKYDGNPGDIIRDDPDGSHWISLGTSKALFRIFMDTQPDVTLFEGQGMIQSSYTCSISQEGDTTWYSLDGEQCNIHVEGFMQSPDGKSSGRILAQYLLRDGVEFQYNLVFAPMGWDLHTHK